MSRYDHKIETSLEGIEHLSKEKKEPNSPLKEMNEGKDKFQHSLSHSSTKDLPPGSRLAVESCVNQSAAES